MPPFERYNIPNVEAPQPNIGFFEIKIIALLKTSNLWNELKSKFLNNISLLINLSGKMFTINSWISIGKKGFNNFTNVKIKKSVIIESNKNFVLIIKSEDSKTLMREFLELVFNKKNKINRKFIKKTKNKFFFDLLLTKKYKEKGKTVDNQ